ncbi:hypothetical protein H0E87_007497 [Populus deltoides]|uniref:Pentatricopeptide repeat-containing protein n=1 Tax=Populus deltoides TaxID=3696 RepID=A0A8T2ZB53_POPDE|nr:hypothetical protein H0E87_007497 [Populus deltoides]
MGHSGFLFFCQMLQNGAEMDCRSFVLALKACEQFLRVLGGKSVHCEMDFLSMTDGYSKRNCWDETSKLFDSMSVEGNVEPEEVTMIAARSACSQKGGLRSGKSFHEYVRLEMEITMNVKCGCLDSARGIIDTMGVRDVFSWTSMVNGYAKSGELELARMSFNEMLKASISF